MTWTARYGNKGREVQGGREERGKKRRAEKLGVVGLLGGK
jgi:hypothetical protein